MKRRRWVRALRWSIPFVIAILLPVGYWGYQSSRGNFHAVTPGEAYRSATLGEDLLAKYIAAYGIRSVINLRTADDTADWYLREVGLCERLSVEHHSLPLTAYAAPTPEQVAGLLRLFETVPRPVLIHCRAGADRSGLAAAMWKVVEDGATKEEAKAQLSLRYGHVPIGPTSVLDDFFETWEPLNLVGVAGPQDPVDLVPASP